MIYNGFFFSFLKKERKKDGKKERIRLVRTPSRCTTKVEFDVAEIDGAVFDKKNFVGKCKNTDYQLLLLLPLCFHMFSYFRVGKKTRDCVVKR